MIDSYVSSFAPGMAWDDLCGWPPDVFALANLVLDQTEAYRVAVALPAGRAWPPAPDWNEQVVAAAAATTSSWRATASDIPSRSRSHSATESTTSVNKNERGYQLPRPAGTGP
jgi:hypothetical protein